MIAVGSAVPALVAATAPNIAAYSLTGTMHYNIALMSTEQFVERNPNFLSNTYDFASNLIIGASSDAPSSLYGMAGAGLNYGYNRIMDAMDSSRF